MVKIRIENLMELFELTDSEIEKMVVSFRNTNFEIAKMFNNAKYSRYFSSVDISRSPNIESANTMRQLDEKNDKLHFMGSPYRR